MSQSRFSFTVVDNQAIVAMEVPGTGELKNVTFELANLTLEEKQAVRKTVFVALNAIQLHILPVLADAGASSVPKV